MVEAKQEFTVEISIDGVKKIRPLGLVHPFDIESIDKRVMAIRDEENLLQYTDWKIGIFNPNHENILQYAVYPASVGLKSLN